MIISAEQIIFGDKDIKPQKGAVLISQGKIKSIGTVEELIKKFPNEIVEYFEGATLLPGLIDMHIHMGLNPSMNLEDFDDYMWALSAMDIMKKAVSEGITCVRDMGSKSGLAATIKKARANGMIVSPKIFSSSNGICMTGGHGYGGIIATECDGKDEIIKSIRTQAKDGAQWIKILTSEAFRGEEFSQEELNIAVKEAHRLGKKIAVHAGYIPSVEMAIKAGFDSIEHGTYMTYEEAEIMAKTNKTWIPTIHSFVSVKEAVKKGNKVYEKHLEYIDKAIEMYQNNFKNLLASGVRVACGTDQMIDGNSNTPVSEELKCMISFGMSPLQALEAATKNGAEALGINSGQIREGFQGDILIVKGDPIENIEALKAVLKVFIDGEPVFGK